MANFQQMDAPKIYKNDDGDLKVARNCYDNISKALNA